MGAIQLGQTARWPLHEASRGLEQFEVDDIDASVFSSDQSNVVAHRLPKSALTTIASYIPAEALGFYVTATALLGYPRGRGDALIAGCSLVLVAVLVLVGYSNNRASGPTSPYRLFLALFFAIFAACVYISALPQSFIHEWPPYTSKVGAVVLLGSSILMPAMGELLKFGHK